MKNLKKVFSRLPKKEEIEYAIHSFSKVEWIFFIILSLLITVSSIFFLTKVNQSFLIERPRTGGELNEGILGSPRFINPVIEISDADKDLTKLIYSGLVRKDSENRIINDLAEEISISNDGLIYNIKLKDNIYFHDGKPVTAKDISFTIEKIKDPLIKSPKKLAWDNVSVDIINEKNILFTLRQPYASFLENNLTIGILPEHIWGDISAEEFPFSKYNIESIGSGPYKVSNIQKKQSGVIESITLASFNKFSIQKPFIKKIKLSFYGGERELINSFTSKNTRKISAITPQNANILDKSDVKIDNPVLPRIFGVFFNPNEQSIFLDKNIIKALDLAIDKNKIIDEVFYGYAIAIDSPIPKNTSLSKLTIEERALNIVEAKNLIEKSGWKEGEDGIFEKEENDETKKLTFSISTADTDDLKNTASMIKEDLRDIGVNVEIKVFESGTLNQTIIRPRKYDALLFGQIVTQDSDLYAFWHSSRRNDPGLNVSMYTNSKVDTDLEDLLVIKNENERQQKYKQIEEQIKKDSPAIFLYSPFYIYISKDNIKNNISNEIKHPSERFNNIYEWYIKSEKVWKIFRNLENFKIKNLLSLNN